MKVFLVANGYPTKYDPQWGCFERDQAVALKQAGHEVVIIALDTRFRKNKRTIGVRCFTDGGISVYWGYWFPTGWIKITRFRDYIHRCLFNRVFRRAQNNNGTPDIIYAHFQRNIFFASDIRRNYRIPVVGIEHWSALMKEPLSNLVKYRGDLAYHNVDVLLAVSKSLSNKIKEKFGVQPEVVYNMLGPEFLDYEPFQKNPESKFQFVAIGSLLPRKGFDILIDAFYRSGLYSKCKLAIIGDGKEREKLEKQIMHYGLLDSITLLGRKTKNEIVDYLRRSDVFVLSSLSETFGVVCIEAMSQGLPVVATKCGGPEEFVSEDNGILVPPEDVDEFSEALRTIYKNYTRYDRNAISIGCKERFSPEAIANQLTKIFESELKKHKKRL